MREHNIEFAELRRAGWYFKANQLSFDIPGLWRKVLVQGAFIALGVFFVATGQFVQKTDYALMTVKATGTWFWVGKNEAYSLRFDFPEMLRGDAWRLQQGDCRYIDDPKPALDIWDKDVICHLVLGFNEGAIAEAIDSQVATALILNVVSIGCFSLFVLFAFWLQRAKELHAQLEAESSTGDAKPHVDAKPETAPIPATEAKEMALL